MDAVVTVNGICLTLSTNAVDYGTQNFSTSQGNSVATQPGPTIGNCGSSNIDVAVNGTNATDGSSVWNLTNTSGGSQPVCPTLSEYGHFVTEVGQPTPVDLDSQPQQFVTGVAPGANVPTEASLVLPCSGSSGAGNQFAMSIVYMATANGGGGLQTWYLDADGDLFGDPLVSVQDVAAPQDYVANGSDCNDGDSSINPSAPEVADGIDNNCDGQIDEGLVCDDGNPLTIDTLDPNDGSCVFTPVPDGTPCDDGNPFTVNDAAVNGQCIGVPLDTDADGLTDEEEVTVYGTDPNLPDTDGDGLTDSEEILLMDPFLDTDNDGLNDGPQDPDSDNDGFTDGEEVAANTNPVDDTDFPGP